MRHIILAIVLALMACAPCAEAQTGVTRCVNPLSHTDIPDNDVIRVGDDFYMISTTSYFCPGAPIMHSKDLVHWRIVSYVYDTIADDDTYNLRGGHNAYGAGQWAASLRWHDGMFYVVFASNDQQQTYIYRTRDIVNGKWTRSAINRVLHDPGLLIDDDGRAYIVYGNGELRIIELNSTLTGIKEGGIDQLLISTPRQGYGLRAEGSHFYHIGDYYYVIEIDWPTGQPRTERCWRSRTLLGEYEQKVILKGGADGRHDGVAQGAIFDTPRGDWYAMMFQDHGCVGRIPTLQPLTWKDGWPVLGDNARPVEEFDVNLPPFGTEHIWQSDEFSYGSGKLDLVWQWNHKPIDSDWSLTARRGWLRLATSTVATGLFDARNTLTQRTVGPRSVTETKIDASALRPGDRAGLCAFQSNWCGVGVEVDPQGRRFIVAQTGTRQQSRDVVRVPLKGKQAWLRIRYVFTPQQGDTCGADKAFMSWSDDGKRWHDVDFTLQMQYTLDLFTGYRAALYCYSTTTPGGHADFDYFRQWVY